MKRGNLILSLFLISILVISGCGPQIIEVGLTKEGYTPSIITVNVNQPVTLKNDGTLGGCGMYLNQPEIGMSANFVNNDTYTFTPKIKGTFVYTCSMGMFKGTIKVIW